MPLQEGTRRDIAVIRAVRETVGPACVVMIDANNGYNLNLSKRVLRETAEDKIFWLEEAFHEDAILYRTLATLRLDAPVFETVDELEWKGPAPEFERFCHRFQSDALYARAMTATSSHRV